MDEQKKWFLKIKSAPSEDSLKIVEITKYLKIFYKLS